MAKIDNSRRSMSRPITSVSKGAFRTRADHVTGNEVLDDLRRRTANIINLIDRLPVAPGPAEGEMHRLVAAAQTQYELALAMAEKAVGWSAITAAAVAAPDEPTPDAS